LIPEEPSDPLLNFQLQRPAAEATEWRDPVDVTLLAADVATDATDDDLRAFLDDWRDGTDLMAETLADEAQFSLIRPSRTFHAACDALCRRAERRLAGGVDQSGASLHKRGLMLARLNRQDEAIGVLQQALDAVPDEARYEVYQAMALAQQESDPEAAIQNLTTAIACSPQLEITCGMTYNRGVLRLSVDADSPLAVDDFSFVAHRSTSTTLRHSALRARARALTDRNDHDGAIADYTTLLAEAQSTPRTAVSAWMDRGILYRLQGRTADAIADWTRAIDAADAGSLQRFRSLEARAQVLAESGQRLAAAADYEAMASYTNASRNYRDELRRTAARLRKD
jgi:tetratricopeptide (TPR) repeat protein